MSRILVVTQPEYGHVLPLIPILERLQQCGHEIIVLTTQELFCLFTQKGFMVDSWLITSTEHRVTNPAKSGYGFWFEFGTLHPDVPVRAAILERLDIAARIHDPDYYVVDSVFLTGWGIEGKSAPFNGRVTFCGNALPDWQQAQLDIEDPLVILCPQEFEIPCFRIQNPKVHYVEPACSQPIESTLTELNVCKPMVLTTFGTQCALQRSFLERIDQILTMAETHCEIQFIIAIGESPLKVLTQTKRRIPDNVVLRTRVPQRLLLEHASVFVTHGGLSSIKEAVMQGVPMIITPEVFDQPFNAMRAVYHGLSGAIFQDELNVETLNYHLDAIMHRSAHRDEIARFQELFVSANSNPRAASLIEEQLIISS